MPPKKMLNRRKRRAAAAKRQQRRSLANSEFASMKQTVNLSNDAMNTVWRMEGITLAAFDRAVQVARAYQYYRITKLEFRFKPLADTFANPNAQSVPYLHYLIVKNDNLDIGTFNGLRDAGAKPIRFDDKTITVAFKPGVANATILEDVILPAVPTYNWGTTKVSPWLATSYVPSNDSVVWQPSKVPHKGLIYGVQQDYSVETQYYDVAITAHFQFKKPMNQTATAPVPAQVKNLLAAPQE